jgi:hypothetical protein
MIVPLGLFDGCPVEMSWLQGDGTEKTYRGTFVYSPGPLAFFLDPGPGGYVEGRGIPGPVFVTHPSRDLTLTFGGEP